MARRGLRPLHTLTRTNGRFAAGSLPLAGKHSLCLARASIPAV